MRAETPLPSLLLRRLLAAWLVILPAGAAAAPVTADWLIAKNLEARGGAKAIEAVRNVTLAGRSLQPGGLQLDYKQVRVRTGNGGYALRLENALQGLAIVEAYDGRHAWRVNQLRGRRDPEIISGDEERALADEARIEGPLLSARASGSLVEYLGREEIDGTQAYALKVTEKDGDEFVLLLDPDTFLEIHMAETRRLRGAAQATEYDFGDYEKVGGVYFPMAIDTWARGSAQRSRITIATAAVNAELPGDLFSAPETKAR